MKILVLVKHVPDAAGDRSFSDDTTTDRAAVDGRLSELDEYAVEQALQVVEKAGEGEITFRSHREEGDFTLAGAPGCGEGRRR